MQRDNLLQCTCAGLVLQCVHGRANQVQSPLTQPTVQTEDLLPVSWNTCGCSPPRKQGAVASPKGWQAVFITVEPLQTSTAQTATSVDQNSSFVKTFQVWKGYVLNQMGNVACLNQVGSSTVKASTYVNHF